METPASSVKSPFRAAARAAIISGIFGIVRIGSLIGYLVLRSSDVDASILVNRLHDASISIQFLLLIPVVVALHKWAGSPVPSVRLTTGVMIISLVALCSLLIIPQIMSDILYTLPQGAFGVWLIFFCSGLKNTLSKGLRRLGTVVGIGLTLIGIFLVGYVILVSPIPLRIPAASFEEASQIPITTANAYLHYFLDVGSLLGVLLLPVWSILVGMRLLRR